MLIIAPYARPTRSGNPSPKDYPYAQELVDLLNELDYKVVQVCGIGQTALDHVQDCVCSPSMNVLDKIITECQGWISVDSFLQHYCWSIGKSGIVLFGPSDPIIFGHRENINLLKNRSYLRPNQFDIWDTMQVQPECFVSPFLVADVVNNFF